MGQVNSSSNLAKMCRGTSAPFLLFLREPLSGDALLLFLREGVRIPGLSEFFLVLFVPVPDPSPESVICPGRHDKAIHGGEGVTLGGNRPAR